AAARKERAAQEAAARKERAAQARARKEAARPRPSPAPARAPPPRPPARAPKGVPDFRVNRDGTVTGRIYGSPSYYDGDSVTTSLIPGAREADTVVTTASRSRYFLSSQKTPGGVKGGAPARELAREPARETEQRSVLGGFLKDMYEDTSSSSSSSNSSITSESTDGISGREFPSHPMRSGTSDTSSLTNSGESCFFGCSNLLPPVLEMENPHAYSPMPAQHRLAPALEPENPHAYNPMPQHWHARQDEHELAPLQHQHAPQDELSLTSPLRVARESRPTNVSSDSEAGCVVDFSDWLDDLVPGEEDGGGGDNNKAPKRDLAEQCSVS
ncbi:hypothetical protein TeGR_g10798, partial [Tetraparma gracilis]